MAPTAPRLRVINVWTESILSSLLLHYMLADSAMTQAGISWCDESTWWDTLGGTCIQIADLLGEDGSQSSGSEKEVHIWRCDGL